MANFINLYKEHTVLIEEPHIQSLAAGVKLNRYYRKLDPMRSMHNVRVWLKYRANHLKEEKIRMGSLICRYCGKRDLLKEVPDKSKRAMQATLDHIVPLSKGGDKFSKDNIVIACYPCNSKKKNNPMWGSKKRKEVERLICLQVK